MASAKAKGSIFLEILIVILIVALIATILYPSKIWKEEEQNTINCRKHMDQIFKAEMIFLKYHNNYTDSLDQLVSFFKEDTTKEVIRDYYLADTSLAVAMTDFLTRTDSAAELIVRNLFADTLMFSIIEAIDYDSNLARVILNRLESTSLKDSVLAKRGTGNDDVAILKELDRQFAGIDIYEPIKDDDSLSLVFERTGSVIDTLYALNQVWAQQVDSAVFYAIDDFRTCPTVNREYIISVIDTSVIKYVNIECPIDSLDIEATKANFVKYHLGHNRIENHGRIETGEKSWSR